MTILEFVVAINTDIADATRRFHLLLSAGTGGVDIRLIMEKEDVGSVALTEDGSIQYVILRQSAPVKALRHLERHVPEVPVK